MQLFPVQQQFVDSDARFVSFLADRGAGKTMAGVIKAIRKIRQGKSGVIVAPSFAYLKWATFPEFRKWAPWDLLKGEDRGRDHPHTIQRLLKFLIEGQEVRVYYGLANTEAWRGIGGVNWVWFDGIDEIEKRPFDFLVERIQRGDHAQVWVTGADPRDDSHWLNDIFRLGPMPDEIPSRIIWHASKRPFSDSFPVHEQYNLTHVDPEQRALIMELYPALCQNVSRPPSHSLSF